MRKECRDGANSDSHALLTSITSTFSCPGPGTWDRLGPVLVASEASGCGASLPLPPLPRPHSLFLCMSSSSSSSFKRKSSSASSSSPLQKLLDRIKSLEDLVEEICKFLECPVSSAGSSLGGLSEEELAAMVPSE